ncbi:MAG: hypothetical protein KDC18_07870 [Alphaproteobacteria bacterium]|nr:hypothetical protein [Alphaproteobacteria bacterium]MCB9929239.1 hypothetical protein [Alphaproteobacteria bacterium]
MLTLEDCLALCELTREEIDAIAEHEHLPETLAMEMGEYLVHTVDGQKRIRRMIEDDIAEAQSRGDHRHSAALKLALKHFCEYHKDA